MGNKQHNQSSNVSQQSLEEGIESVAQQATDIMANAEANAEAMSRELGEGKSEAEVAKIKQDLLAKEIQKGLRKLAYPVVGGFQPSQKRYWADVGVRAFANTFVLVGTLGAAAYMLRKREGTNVEGVENPFNTTTTASERPSSRRNQSA